MKMHEIDALLAAYGLGARLAGSARAIESLTHTLMRVDIPQGRFLLKRFHPVLVRQPAYVQRVRTSVALAGQLQAKGVAVSRVLRAPGHSDFFYQYDQHQYMLTAWVEGDVLDDAQLRVQHVAAVAKWLANMHCQLPVGKANALDLPLVALNYRPQRTRWQAYVQTLLRRYPAMAPYFVATWPCLDALHIVPTYYQCLAGDTVLCHGDIDPNNIVWNGDSTRCTVIDWEWAGIAPRVQACWASALSLSRAGFCQWDQSRFTAFWQHYAQAVSAPAALFDAEQLKQGFYTLCAYWFEWADWTIQRLLALPGDTAQAQRLLTIITRLLQTLQILLTQRKDMLCAWAVTAQLARR